MALTQLTHVTKRDGRLVPFEPGKIARSLLAAAAACGLKDSFYARELADAVTHYLARTHDERAPTTEMVALSVEQVLDELRFPHVASAYRAYRASRELSRARCVVVKPAHPSLIDAESSLTVVTGRDQRSGTWDRSRIVLALEREAHIPRTAAEDVARAVEAKLLGSDLSQVTTSLIRALADNELLSRGYSSALRQRSSVTVPFTDVDAVLSRPECSTSAATLGAEAFKPYVLSRIYSDDVATAHRRGLFHLHGLEFPFHRHALLLTADIHAHAARVQCRQVFGQLLCGECSTATWCFDHADALARLPEMADWFSGLDGEGRVRCAVPIDAAGTVRGLLGTHEPAPAVSIVFNGAPRDIEESVGHATALVASGWHVGWVPAAPWHELNLRITINLPQAVYRARHSDLDAAIEEVYRSVEFAAAAHRQYAQFCAGQGRPLNRGSAGAFTVAGLNEAVSILTGAGMFDGADSTACVRVLLNVLQTTIQRASVAHDRELRFVVGEPDSCGKRLAVIDQSLFPELFGFLPFQPEAVEHAIPPYSTIALQCAGAADIGPVIEAARLLNRYFDCGAVPIHVEADAGDAVADLLRHAIRESCGCRIAAAVMPAQEEEEVSSSQLPLPGIAHDAPP